MLPGRKAAPAGAKVIAAFGFIPGGGSHRFCNINTILALRALSGKIVEEETSRRGFDKLIVG